MALKSTRTKASMALLLSFTSFTFVWAAEEKAPPSEGKAAEAAPALAPVAAPAPAAATAAVPAPAQHWSYTPVVAPAIPAVQQKDWVRQPLDAFVLAKLEAKGLKPSPDADRATYIRRATLD